MHSALLSGDPHDQLAIAYHLIVDNKRIADEAAKAELRGLNFFIDQLFLKFLFFFCNDKRLDLLLCRFLHRW